MALFKLSFSQKVQLYACTVSLLSLLIMGAAFISYDIKESRRTLIENLQLKADLVGSYSSQALVQGDMTKANEILDFISNDPFIIGAWIFSKDYHVRASYNPRGVKYLVLPQSLREQGVYFEKNLVKVVRDIKVGKNQVGEVMVISVLEGVEYRALNETLIVFMVSLLSLLTAILFSSRLQRSLTKPLHNLVQSVNLVTQKKDYSIRVSKLSDDDLGTLTDAFNAMLQEVSERDSAITKSEERLNLALWGSNEILFDWDIFRDSLYFDESFESILGYERKDIPSKTSFFKFIHVQDAPIVEEVLQKHLVGEDPFFTVECRFQHRNGQWYWLMIRGKVVDRNKRGRALRMVGTLMDVTTHKEAEEKLKLFNKVFETTTEGVMVTDPQFCIVEVNPAFASITGYSRDDIVGKSMDILHSEKQTEEFYRRMRYSLQVKGYWQGELWEKRKNGEVYPQRMAINTMQNEQNQLTHYVAVFSDITQTKQTEDELHYLTHYDSLTSLPNRTLFMRQLETAVQRAQTSNKKIALILVGLDNFKIINDSFGHDIGDCLLQAVAKRLLRCLDKQNQVARITGDEFALILEQTKDRHEIQQFSRQVLEMLAANFVIKTHDILLGASIGVSFFPDDSKDVNELFLHADTALYHAKQAGRNCYKFYTSEMNDKVQARQRMEALLRSALANEEFTLLYQPKIDARTGRISGAEALIRWLNPELGWVSPAEFIPVAEDTGVIVPIGQWVLKTACKQNKEWHDSGFKHMRMSVNLSGYQFRASDLVEDIARILWETKILPQSLDLELTESVLMDNAERCVLMLEVLKSMGMTISVDDFGTGYSSLSYLRKFPIDALKIDRSFVRNICSNPEDASIVKAIIAMAKGLKIRVIAEGVETKEQVRYLMEQEINEFQGYYFSMPLTAEEFTNKLRQDNAQVISF